MAEQLDGYTLSRNWFNWSFENPDLINPGHSAVYFFAIEHCNRLGWKQKFGFPTQMVMDAIGIKKHQTYIKYFNDLCEWGFFILVQKSTNQYSANIISLSTAYTKNGKALDKAFIKHGAKQIESIGQSTGQSKDSIDKQLNKEQIDIVLLYLNSVANKKFKTDSEANKKFISGRLKSYSVEDLKRVIDLKVPQWIGTNMAKYIRPSTLFNEEKFESYINELPDLINEVDLKEVRAKQSKFMSDYIKGTASV